MSELFMTSCNLCNEKFSIERPQIILPCKVHSFCKICVARIELKEDKKCPTCHEKWTESLLDPTYLALAKISFSRKPDKAFPESSKQQNEVLCSDHDIPLKFWCSDCRDLLCSRCVTSTHQNGDFKIAAECFSDIKELLQNDAINTSGTISDYLTAQNSQIEEAEKLVVRLEKLASSITKKLLLTRTKISSMVKSREDLETLQEKLTLFAEDVKSIDQQQQLVCVRKRKLLMEGARTAQKVIKLECDGRNIVYPLIVS